MNRSSLLKQFLLLFSLLVFFSGMSYADRDRRDHDRFDKDRGDRYEHYDRYRQDRWDRRDTRIEKRAPEGYRFDQRYGHDHYYPKFGYRFNNIPRDHYRVHFHDDDYYFHAGIWYRPYGGRYIVIRPPIGIVVPILPAFYTTIWFGGVPYYYANNVYYTWDPARDGYIVTNPPQQMETEQPQYVPDQLYVYPKRGQSEKKQEDDRFACYQWSVKQTNFDPTQPPNDLSQEQLNHKREEYRRAMKACLEGRGYSVR